MSARKVAEHLGKDVGEVHMSRYQPAKYKRPIVYLIDDVYWCASKPTEGGWKEIVSLFDGKTKLWCRKE